MYPRPWRSVHGRHPCGSTPSCTGIISGARFPAKPSRPISFRCRCSRCSRCRVSSVSDTHHGSSQTDRPWPSPAQGRKASTFALLHVRNLGPGGGDCGNAPAGGPRPAHRSAGRTLIYAQFRIAKGSEADRLDWTGNKTEITFLCRDARTYDGPENIPSKRHTSATVGMDVPRRMVTAAMANLTVGVQIEKSFWTHFRQQ
jgi:hypothetical protein